MRRPTDFVARFILGLKRASRCSTDTLDRSIYEYTETCYYETIYIQGGNVIDSPRQRMGETAFWRALKGYVADHRFGLAGTTWLLDALDDGTSLSFTSTYKVRFPALLTRDPSVGGAGDAELADDPGRSGRQPSHPASQQPCERMRGAVAGPSSRPYSMRVVGGSSSSAGYNCQS